MTVSNFFCLKIKIIQKADFYTHGYMHICKKSDCYVSIYYCYLSFVFKFIISSCIIFLFTNIIDPFSNFHIYSFTVYSQKLLCLIFLASLILLCLSFSPLKWLVLRRFDCSMLELKSITYCLWSMLFKLPKRNTTSCCVIFFGCQKDILNLNITQNKYIWML